jgi:hypothetical protein
MRPLLPFAIATLLTIPALPAQAETIPLKPGDYYAQGSLYSRSARRIQSNQESDRICLSVVDGPASPYEGYQTITVSSLFMRGDRIHRDGDGQVLDLTGTGFTMGGGRAGWEHQPYKSDSSLRKLIPQEAKLLQACLTSPLPYSETVQGRFINGIKFPK